MYHTYIHTYIYVHTHTHTHTTHVAVIKYIYLYILQDAATYYQQVKRVLEPDQFREFSGKVTQKSAP